MRYALCATRDSDTSGFFMKRQGKFEGRLFIGHDPMIAILASVHDWEDYFRRDHKTKIRLELEKVIRQEVEYATSVFGIELCRLTNGGKK